VNFLFGVGFFLVVEQRSEESDFIPTNNCLVGKKSSLHSSRIQENESLHYKKNSLTKPFGNLFNTKDQGRRWQLDYLQPLQVLVIHAEVASLMNPNRGTFCKMDKFNDAIQTPIAKLEPPPCQITFCLCFIIYIWGWQLLL
jgi:hypothetical protein